VSEVGGAVGPEPVREWVLKLFERCNLACDHCYMYEAADQGWRDRPMAMAEATVAQVAVRVAEHAEAHDLDEVRMVLHGGEPLLAGVAKVTRAIEVIRAAVPSRTRVLFAVQTNGILLSADYLDLFVRHGVSVGVSLDGTRAGNDRHRRYASGRSSFEAVVNGIGLLRQPAFRAVYGGLLCTVDVRNDPVETYLGLLEHEPPVMDFLLPHGNWEFPPPELDPSGTVTRYADWLIAIFDRWYRAPHRETGIRLFESIISLLLGGASDTEAIGPGIPSVVTIESDGSIEGSDGLKVTAPGGGATGMTVFAHSFDEVLRHPAVAASRLGPAGLGAECRRCPIVEVCGGGLHAHRFSATDGFSRPSIYCRDLLKLVTYIRDQVRHDLLARRDAMAGIPA
jgi:uncharacterized protein